MIRTGSISGCCRGGAESVRRLDELAGHKLVSAIPDHQIRAFGRRLQVELQADDLAPDLERLVGAGRAPGEVKGRRR